MKKKISNSLISLLLVFAVLVTSIPLMSWTAIAQTIVPAVLSAENDSVAETSTDASVTSDGHIGVNSPVDLGNYVANDLDPQHYTAAGFETIDDFNFSYYVYMLVGVFDPLSYIYFYQDAGLKIDSYYAYDENGATIYHPRRLFEHWIMYGIAEGKMGSPFFCIECYYRENEVELYNHCVNTAASTDFKNKHPNVSGDGLLRLAAWEHFTSNGVNDYSFRRLSPVFDCGEYMELNPLLAEELDPNKKPSTASLLGHFAGIDDKGLYGHGMKAKDLRRGSKNFDSIAYFYNNNSIYHNEDGVRNCYRKYIRDCTNYGGTSSGYESGCPYHRDYQGNYVIYEGLPYLPDTFTGTLTSVAVMKNIAMSEDGEVISAEPATNENELWQFTKQENGSYIIKLANTDGNVTNENTTQIEKYLSAEIIGEYVDIILTDTPEMEWYIYESDGLYVLRPDHDYTLDRAVLTLADNDDVSATIFGAPEANQIQPTYSANTMNQRFLINTTYEYEADSDGLTADFYATIDAFSHAVDSWTTDTKVSLAPASKYAFTRVLENDTYPSADQAWHFIRQSDGTYKIQNTADGYYLSSAENDYKITGGKLQIIGDYRIDVVTADTNINYSIAFVEKENDSDYQKWIVRKRTDGGYFIMPVAWSNYFYEGTYLQQATTELSLTENKEFYLYNDKYEVGTYARMSVFDITPLDNAPYAEDLNGSKDDSEAFYATLSSAKKDHSDYYLKNNATQERLAVFEDGGNLKTHDYYWKFVRTEDGSYSISSTTTINYCLTVKNGQLYLTKADLSILDNQLWYVFKCNGGYRIQNKETGKVLVMDKNGNLSLDFNNGNNYDDYQLFNIKETDMSIDTAADTFKVNLFNYGHYINQPGADFHVLDFTYNENDALDRRSLDIAAGSVALPEMSKMLDSEGYPYVNNYAFSHRTANSKVTNNIDYGDDVIEGIFLTPNFGTKGSLKYLFDANAGFVNGDKTDSVSEYNPVAVNGDLYQSQSFKVNNPSGLFQKDGEGFYVYDSSKNSINFDIDESSKTENGTMSGTFKVYDYLTHVSGHAPLDEPSYCGMFLPFNIAHEQGVLSYDKDNVYNSGDVINYNDPNTKANKANYTLSMLNRTKNNGYTNELTTGYTTDRTKVSDLWFGMSLETDFYQTKGGKLNGEDVKFEFAGDDDVWVYLDGVLVLDLGSSPFATKSVINFADCTYDAPVKETNNSYSYEDGTPSHTRPRSITNETASIYSAFYAAYQEVKGTVREEEIAETIVRSFVTIEGAELSVDNLPEPNTTDIYADPKLKDYEEHNLKFFYLERGGAASNCYIRLNTLSGGTTVSKVVENLNEEIMENAEYKFQAVYEDGTPVANTPYTLSSASAVALADEGISTASDELTTDKDGYFTLKANQKAIFKKIPLGSNIKVTEISEYDAVNTSWKAYVAGQEKYGDEGKETEVISVPVDSTLDIVFTNDYFPSHDVIVTKTFDPTDSSDNYMPNENQIYTIGYEILDENEEVVVIDSITLHTGETKSIADIPDGYSYRVWEYTPEGLLQFESPKFTVDKGEAVTKAFVAQGGSPDTEAYVEGLVEGENIEIDIENKLVKKGEITVKFKYYNRKRVDGAPAQINSYSTSYTKKLTQEDWDDYLDPVTKRMNFAKLIGDQGIYWNETVGVDNVIDEYVVWTSQAEAEKGFAEQTNHFAGKKEDGSPYTYGETTPESLAYHTNAFGEIANDGEKWVTYYQGNKQIDPEKQGNDLEVTGITVWLFNKPKEYTATLYTATDAPNSIETVDGKDILVGNVPVEFTAFYNQRIANNPENETPSDTNTFTEYLEIYKVSDSDIVKGKNINTEEVVDYVNMPKIVILEEDANSEPYSFQYWAYDPQGRFVASTSFNYAYRITNDITLYAIYGKTGLQFPGLTTIKSGIDYYYSGSGAVQLRLNTIMNPYNCPDNDESITNAAVVYVMLHGSDEYKGMEQDELLDELSKISPNGMSYLDVLREDLRTLLLQSDRSRAVSQTVSTYPNSSVTVIDAELTASGFKFQVQASNGTNNNALTLTSKNRVQFTTEFTKTSLDGRHLLAFTAMKRNESWVVSDNYADYNFVHGFGS